MPEFLSPELVALRERAERFASEVLLPNQRELAARSQQEAAIRTIVTRAARDAGLFAMAQPRSHGGSEATLLAMTVARDAIAGFNTGLDRWVFGPAPGVLADCQGSLRSDYLAPLLAGEKRGGFAVTEPDDAAHFTRAVRADNGDFVITGRKSYVTRGAEADFLNVLCEIEGDGRALLVIDTDRPGVVLERRFETLDGSHHAAFRFDAVRVSKEHVIGRPGEGMPRALRQIGNTRMAIAARAVGLARWTIEHVRVHLTTTHWSGETFGSREGVRLRYAEARIRTFAARSMLYRTARLGDGGTNIVNEAIACKVYATETAGEVVDTAIQLVGGQALIVGHPLERLYRELRALRVAEGASDVLRLNLARGSLDLGKGVL